jgi:hypothetical protein
MSVERLVDRELGGDVGQIDPDSGPRFPQMTLEIPSTLLLDLGAIEDPYPCSRRLAVHAPIWNVRAWTRFIRR